MLRRFWVLALWVWIAATALGQEPVRVSGGVMSGLILTKEDPVYPPIAQAAGVSGAVVLHAIIGADGLVQNLQVVSGPPMLRQAAIDTVRHWTYRPYLLNGEATPVDTTVTVSFGGAGADGTADQGAGSGGGGTGSGGMQASSPGGGQEARPRGPVRISNMVMAGQIVTKVAPAYPVEAKAKGVSGTVVLHAVVSKEGAIENLTVISGPEELRPSAVDAVSQWTYKPYLLNGEPTEVDTTITVNYNMGRPAAAAATGAPAPADELGAGDGPPLGEEPSVMPAMVAPVAGTVRISGSVMAGSIVKKVAPSYPADARAKGISGSVVMRAIIGKDGAISQLAVMSGPEELRGSAMKAVRQWRYRPYRLNGVPTEVDTTITVNYNMGW